MFDFKLTRLILTILAVIVTSFVSDFVVHQVLMKDDYEATKEIWRGPEEMKVWAMMAGQALAAIVFTLLYARGFASGCWTCAIVFGIMFGLMNIATNLIYYSVLPMPMSLALKWSVFGMIQCILFATIAKLVYGKGPIDQKTYGIATS